MPLKIWHVVTKVRNDGKKLRKHVIFCGMMDRSVNVGPCASLDICPVCGETLSKENVFHATDHPHLEKVAAAIRKLSKRHSFVEAFRTADSPAEACPHWIPASGGNPPTGTKEWTALGLPMPIGQAVLPGDDVCPHHCGD